MSLAIESCTSLTPAYSAGVKQSKTGGGESSDAARGNGQLSEEEQRIVDDLKRTDAEVRAHEAAHMAAGGAYVQGGASYSYRRGPDGHAYAVGGEVSIDTSAEKDPAATIRKMQTVQAAALAPANPSGQDRAVAAAAAAAQAQAQIQLVQAKHGTANNGSETGSKAAGNSASKDRQTAQHSNHAAIAAAYDFTSKTSSIDFAA